MNNPISEQYQKYCDLKVEAGFTEQYIMSWNDWQYCWGIAQSELSTLFSERLINKNIENYKLKTELNNKNDGKSVALAYTRSLDEQSQLLRLE